MGEEDHNPYSTGRFIVRQFFNLENEMLASFYERHFRGEAYLIAFVAVVGLLHPLLYWSVFSGDAEIHLVYARNLLRGHPLEFNLDQPNSGETSMGFMLIDALAMWVVGAAMTPLAVKIICLAGLYATAGVTFLVAGRIGLRRPWRELAALLTLWLPGSVYNGMSGTENAVFAAFACAYFYLTLLFRWYDERQGPTLRQDGIAGLLAGALFWLRPEALPLLLILVTVRLAGAHWFGRRMVRELAQLGVLLGVFGAAILAYIAIFVHFSHELPYGAGQARRLMSSHLESAWIGKVPVNIKVLVRIAAYFSIVVPALAVVGWALFRNSSDRSERLTIIALAAAFFGFLAAYLFNVLPSFHFARYTIFIWPFGMLAAALGLQAVAQSHWPRRGLAMGMIATSSLGFVGVAIYELGLRRDVSRNSDSLYSVQAAPERREANSAKLAQSLGLAVGARATLGLQEVDTRYELTDNFEVRSLDGITDSRLLRYLCDGWVDHDGYVIDTKIDYLLEFPSLDRARSVWSIADLAELAVGESVARPGVTYTKIRPRIVKVQRTVDRSSSRPGDACSISRTTELTSNQGTQ